MEKTEQALLQAARNLQQPQPGPALDAAILHAAAERTAEIRRARTSAAVVKTATAVAQTPPTHSFVQRFSLWLLGKGEIRGHLRQVLAVGACVGVALVLVLNVPWENVGGLPQYAPSESTMAVSAAEPERWALAPVLEKDMSSFEQKLPPPAQPSSPSPPPPVDNNASTGRAKSQPRPPSSQTGGETVVQETVVEKTHASPLPETPSAAPPASQSLSFRVRGEATAQETHVEKPHALPPPEAKPIALPPPPSPAFRAEGGATIQETDIQKQLENILGLRRAGKEKEARALLRQLYKRYPKSKVEERLRQLESEEKNKHDKGQGAPST
ncbi:MAG: hypothetical protein FWD46_02070 [Cystobacterineae bacterium]|nr:hypothetical protein [Cystobacterineae bacterium]